jgi:16S rRNA (uracil1498-N3)-methyltransferase
MVERIARTPVATFFSADKLEPGTELALSGEAVRHIQVLRLSAGAVLGIRDGVGRGGVGTLVRLAKNQAVVGITETFSIDPLPPVHLIAPIADRDRMLLLAEKVSELGLTTWRPVLWKRSRSVTPRGEGSTFNQKVRARMLGAMLQSRGGWIPELFPDSNVERAIAATPAGIRILLDNDISGAAAASIAAVQFLAPVTIALGPEGGIEDSEREQFVAAGFQRVSLGPYVLRFETAGIAAVALVRALLAGNTK